MSQALRRPVSRWDRRRPEQLLEVDELGMCRRWPELTISRSTALADCVAHQREGLVGVLLQNCAKGGHEAGAARRRIDVPPFVQRSRRAGRDRDGRSPRRGGYRTGRTGRHAGMGWGDERVAWWRLYWSCPQFLLLGCGLPLARSPPGCEEFLVVTSRCGVVDGRDDLPAKCTPRLRQPNDTPESRRRRRPDPRRSACNCVCKHLVPAIADAGVGLSGGLFGRSVGARAVTAKSATVMFSTAKAPPRIGGTTSS